jgi:hypothetical protein
MADSLEDWHQHATLEIAPGPQAVRYHLPTSTTIHQIAGAVDPVYLVRDIVASVNLIEKSVKHKIGYAECAHHSFARLSQFPSFCQASREDFVGPPKEN